MPTCCVTEHDRFGGGSVMVWAGISIDGKTDLHVIAGNLSGVRYRDEIWHPIVRPYASAVGDEFHSNRRQCSSSQSACSDWLPWEWNNRVAKLFTGHESDWTWLGHATRRPFLHVWYSQTTDRSFQSHWLKSGQRLPQLCFRRLIRSMQRHCLLKSFSDCLTDKLWTFHISGVFDIRSCSPLNASMIFDKHNENGFIYCYWLLNHIYFENYCYLIKTIYKIWSLTFLCPVYIWVPRRVSYKKHELLTLCEQRSSWWGGCC